MNGVAAILLAAGGSRRFGSPKQLHRVAGVSLVRRAAEAATSAGCRPLVVVLGAASDAIAPELESLDCTIVVNDGWREGMSSSIRAGVVRLRQAAPDCSAALLLLADQPSVDERLIGALVERFRFGPELAAACRYGGVLGPPAIFSAGLFGELESLRGDEGARSLLRSGRIEVAELDFPEGAFDVDTRPDGRES
ncbi:MAG TPA: nucleotidyltransferase family protein [Thermoanaerobaculia bacterium]|nr:nucleotidyltransferase family protein [Thermoanaerobaculia bacterium]